MPALKMRVSLFSRIFFAFAIVVLMGIALTAFFANRSARSGLIVVENRAAQIQTQSLAPVLAGYYAQQSSWNGIGDFLAQLPPAGPASGRQPGQGRGRPMDPASGGGVWWLANHRLIISDSRGRVVHDSKAEQALTSLDAAELSSAEPLTVNGETVGFLLITQSDSDALQQEFFQSVNQGLLLGALAASLLALVASTLLARQLASPIRQLTAAARRITQGDSYQQVPVSSHDEVGELADAFNQMARQLDLSETQRRQLLADIAHELRNPLSAMRGNLEGLLDGVLPLGPEQVAIVYNQTLLLSRLVDDLRLLSLAQIGKLSLERVPTDISALVSRVVDDFRPLAHERGSVLQVEMANSLPAVSIDSQRISQVLANLLSNALRYTPAQGQITVAVHRREREVEVTVADTGPGISGEDLPHVFDRFYRADRSRSRAQGGSGLGLAIARELVKAHGGSIWVESTPGRGSKFTFVLPA